MTGQGLAASVRMRTDAAGGFDRSLNDRSGVSRVSTHAAARFDWSLNDRSNPRRVPILLTRKSRCDRSLHDRSLLGLRCVNFW
nr:hypothetical protein Itr_chr07CG11130 [Ipomoea trifida]